MGDTECNNCGFSLTEENITLACQDAGLGQDELIFCCPSYGTQEGWLVKFLGSDDDFFTLDKEEAEQAKKEWEGEYGEGEATIEPRNSTYECCLGYSREDREKAAYWRTA